MSLPKLPAASSRQEADDGPTSFQTKQTKMDLDSRPVADEDEAEVESPCLSTPSARARFEFEAGCGNEGTKVLMVEWDEDNATNDIVGSWVVSWEGKSQVLAAEERKSILASEDSTGQDSWEVNLSQRQPSHRMFFLLLPKKSVPATVVLTLKPQDTLKSPITWKTNPLPAIFPPGFDGTSGETSRPSKGVLHTLWAKKRLQTLAGEIAREAQLNSEGVGLQMALEEQEWIESTFGVANSTPKLDIKPIVRTFDTPLSPTSPLSPGGGRLSEKLRGLKLQTGDNNAKQESSALNPEEQDVAVPECLAKSSPNSNRVEWRVAVADDPRSRFHTKATSMPSMGEILSGIENSSGSSAWTPSEEQQEEEELFALPLSPRSPDMTKSPFSFATSDTMKYLQKEQKVS